MTVGAGVMVGTGVADVGRVVARRPSKVWDLVCGLHYWPREMPGEIPDKLEGRLGLE